MAEGLKTIDVSNMPEALEIARRVQQTNEAQVLSINGENIAVVMPLPMAASSPRKGRSFTKEDSLFKLIGIGHSGISGGISEKKHEYLLETNRRQHR